MKTRHDKMKKAAVIFLAACGLLILIQIAVKIARSSEKPGAKAVSVTVETAGIKEINEIVTLNGVAEGDPQVKIYPFVNGKFERQAISEGGSVKKGQAILFINRDIAGMDFKLSPVNSPIDGIVTRLYVTDKGAAVSPDRPVAEAADPENIKAVLYTGEEEIVKIKKGMPARITAGYTGAIPLEGSVYSVTPFIDRDTMAGTIIVKAANTGDAVKPGMSVKVEINTGMRKAVIVPRDAVLSGAGRVYVFVNDNGKAKAVNVATGWSNMDETEISSGLNGGEEVIVEGNFKLNEGSDVSVGNDEAQSQNSKVKSQK